MKRLLIFAVLLISVLVALPTLHKRWSEERNQRKVRLIVDWKEARDLANREIPSSVNLMQVLREAGIQGVLFAPLTLKDSILGGEPALISQSVSFKRESVGEQAFDELTRRGVSQLEVDHGTRRFTITRPVGDFSSLGDIEIGYDTNLMELSRDQGLSVFLRLNSDPWLKTNEPLPADIAGIIFTTDDPPGGVDSIGGWAAQLQSQNLRHLLIEFKPTRAAVAIARAAPGATLRTHTIPTAELKDMTPAQELSRWERAVRERACRCLLFRPAPSESWGSFLARLDALRRALLQEGWFLDLPSAQAVHPTSNVMLLIQLGIAFAIAALAPLLGLFLAHSQTGWRAFLTVIFVSLAGAFVVAAIAYGPETRYEIVPFRGIKAAIIISWLGSLAVLYSRAELKQELKRSLTRTDLLVGLFLMVVIGYGIVRSGNASPSLRSGSEQGIRDYLEKAMTVRPRFKEFAIGYPLLLVGFLIGRKNRKRGKILDTRPLVWLGMIGPISTLNTFCHLHSPLALACARSGLGIFLGSLLGMLLYFFYSFFEEAVP